MHRQRFMMQPAAQKRFALLFILLLHVLSANWFVGLADAARIIGASKTLGKSHHLNLIEILRGLAARGHEVAIVVSELDVPFFEKHTKESLPDITMIVQREPWTMEQVDEIIQAAEEKSYMEYIPFMLKVLKKHEHCPFNETVGGLIPAVKRFEPDLFLVNGAFSCTYVLAEALQVPYVTYYTIQPLQPLLQVLHGIRTDTARQGSMGLGFDSYAPTFVSRLANQLFHWGNVGLLGFTMSLDHQFKLAGLPNLTLQGSAQRSRLVILASDPFLDGPVPLPSFVKAVGALLPKEEGTLQPELAAILSDNARQTIYMSFGTTGVGHATSSLFISVWRNLPHVQVIWKVKDREDPALAGAAELPNVHVFSWVDQNAVLAHPNLSMFITHGGHNSISETAFHGVPILAVAVFGDQWDSAARAVHHGFGESLDKKKLSPEVIQHHVIKILNTSTYKEAAMRISRGMKQFRRRHDPLGCTVDLIEDQLEAISTNATTWPQQLPALPWWRSSQADVYLAVVVLGFACAVASWMILSFIGKMCCKPRRKGMGNAGDGPHLKTS